RRGHTSVYQGDFTEKKMITFGGYDGTNHYNDVWKLDITTPGSETWTQVTPLGTAPLARRSHSAIYDPVNQRMIIQAGRGTLTPVNFMSDFWQLTLPTSTSSWTWTQVIPDVYLRGSVPVTGLTVGTSYHWQAWATGTSSGDSAKTAYGGNGDAPPAGVDFTVSLPPPTITAINPNEGGNNAPVSITSVAGTNFVSTPTMTTVKLIKSGNPDIPCAGFTFISSTALSDGICDITSALIGAWNVIVTNPDAQTSTLTGGFTIYFAVTGSLISSTFDTGYTSGVSFNSIMWRGNPGTGGSVKFQLGSSNCPNGATNPPDCLTGSWSDPSSYLGPNGTPNSFYSSTTDIGIGEPLPIVTAHHKNKRYYRYKVYLDFKEKIPGDTKPVVDEVIVNWSL
ncbi:MAG: hypothetical protein HYR95_02880, partial [Candidatus Colwellbacteria bacterium]|nr:hypothetical protein [Candidatus Colwellbacteria bacterium]